ncbi:LacI family DNA-binding transcriptional regulator [Occultella gossypii]|uniref:LacI family DNA-binding transcriptional regulator n=1 Tax=Occultella gossypii TaxID=2800820 RepID=A0ABS7S5G9_9MICO|nr:LacI family DNA-binding transcriptional regulator [Occultella gossypii]MBZ2195584.1 LacI family DNA-binding transcriptional regulator [Occultella gossypii]
MADVAEAAGVSRATVSRVLSHDPAVVEATAAVVREAIERLGYRPNRAAQALMGASRTLGVIFGEPPDRASALLLRGINEAATSKGYALTVAIATDAGGEELRRGLNTMVEQSAAAVMVLPATRLNADVLAAADVPFPIISTTDLGPGSPCSVAALDELGAVDAVVGHLQEIGRNRILHIGARHETLVSQFRRGGWQARVDEADLFEMADEWSARGGYEALHRAVARGARPDAVFAASDEMALGAMSAAGELGLRVPEDLAVAGFGGLPVTEFYGPGLTTVATAPQERGALAFEECMRRLSEPDSPPAHRLLEGELVMRPSTVPAGGSPGVSGL